jgi:hypothetical protein
LRKERLTDNKGGDYMKRFIFTALVIAMMLFGNVASADEWRATPWINTSFGGSFIGGHQIVNLMVGLDLWYDWGDFPTFGITTYSGVEVLMDWSGRLSFYPWQDTYTIGGTIHFGPVYANLNHWCAHEVYSGTYANHDGRWYADADTTFTIGIKWPQNRVLW